MLMGAFERPKSLVNSLFTQLVVALHERMTRPAPNKTTIRTAIRGKVPDHSHTYRPGAASGP